ncbi:YCR051W [Saccharomyces arboricola H-6]|uniref:YCR051W n=1 Tax=Saccharomyces arboricola (strain H-6 / AS 2.3317 / CBS 10644) TaxID=1160507 RepID=J8Q791_SACAR|nr:YCR051W [Saccharomyces arboricola H-6]
MNANIWVAASDGNMDRVEGILRHSNGTMTPQSKDINGYTPMHAAAAYGHVDLLKKMCNEYNGDINVLDNDGDTPLHHVEDVGTAKVIVEELGGNYTIRNSEGQTPYDSYVENGEDGELIEYMRIKSGVVDAHGGEGSHDGGEGIINSQLLEEFKDSVRYTLENDPEDGADEATLQHRRQLEQIITGDNVEEELERYIRTMVREQMLGQGALGGHADEPDSKRRK